MPRPLNACRHAPGAPYRRCQRLREGGLAPVNGALVRTLLVAQSDVVHAAAPSSKVGTRSGTVGLSHTTSGASGSVPPSRDCTVRFIVSGTMRQSSSVISSQG